MTNFSSRQIAELGQMAILQAKILRSAGLVREASQLAEHGMALAFSAAFVSPARLVPVTVRR